MLKMVDGAGIIGVDMVCPLGGTVSPPQPPNYDNVEMEGVGSLMLPNSLKAPLERVELIGNSVQGENPAPDNPQEIKSAGRKSKNLLIENISVFTVQDNIAYIPLPEGHETKLYTMLIQKKPGENDDVGFTCGFYDKSNMTATYSAPCLQAGNLVTGNGIVNSKIGVNHFVCFSPADSRFFDIYNVMYAEGKETTLDYEPYGYLLDVKVTGKNLLDMADIQNENGKIDSDFSKAKSIKPFKVIKDRKYLLISKGTMIVDVRYSSIYFGEDDLAYEQGSSKKLTTGTGYSCFIGTETRKILVAKETCTITKTMMHGTRTEKDAYEVEELGLFEIINDNPNIDYEPYKEQTLQIALDVPLMGIVRITDGKNVQESLNSSGITRRFKEVEITKDTPITNTLGQYGAPETNTVICRYKDTSLKKTGAILCGELKNVNNWAKEEESVAMTEQGIDFRLSRERLGLGSDTTPEENKVAVIKYLTEHPLHCVAELNVPTTEPLPESVQTQLRNLHTENGTTHVFVDSGEVEAGIKLTYRKEK